MSVQHNTKDNYPSKGVREGNINEVIPSYKSLPHMTIWITFYEVVAESDETSGGENGSRNGNQRAA